MRCFVISPIGDPGSKVRQHSDEVFRFIIKPAMDELGVEAYRSDHSNEIGRISDQMFKSILYDDLCIAVLTYHNPNVFYELAVAQSAARPVIILAEKGTPIPFDLKDDRVIEYDLSLTSYDDRVYIDEVANKARKLKEISGNERVPFAPHLSPLGGSRILSSHVKAEDFGPSDAWIDLLRESEHEFLLCGINVARWTKPKGIGDLFSDRARSGCKVRILISSPDNPSLPCLLNEASHQGSIAKTIQGIHETEAFFISLLDAGVALEIRMMERCTAHQLLVINEKRALVVPYLYSNATFRSPLFEISAEADLHRVFRAEFESLWASSEVRDGGKPKPQKAARGKYSAAKRKRSKKKHR
jgi:hypothetical protein